MFLGAGQEFMIPVWQKPFYSFGQVYFVALSLFVNSIPIHHRKKRNEQSKCLKTIMQSALGQQRKSTKNHQEKKNLFV